MSSVAIPERHITNAAAAVNLDIRAFDTMIEVYIVLASVLGALLLLRRHPMNWPRQDTAGSAIVPPAPGWPRWWRSSESTW